jgi:GNAT superfamily N-acetyltransferase
LLPLWINHEQRFLYSQLRCAVTKELDRDIFPRRRGDASLAPRVASAGDLDAIRALMELSIAELQKPHLDAQQITSSRLLMGLDTQLVDDQTYFVVEIGAQLAGCGGWSRRATLYGGDATPGRSPALLDPRNDAARIRAMYTHPAHVRKGVGRLILQLCERAAMSEGFRRAELVATLSGEALYSACGYVAIERFSDARGGVAVPLVRMAKAI